MKKLAKRQEEIMQALWHLQEAFIKDVVDALPEPKPHYNTVATMVKGLEEEGFIAHRKFGNTYQYYPLISRESYQKEAVDDLLSKYFNSSSKNLIAYFAKEEKINEAELEEILRMIQNQKPKP